MTGRGRELADMMELRNVDILCLQETKRKGSKVRNIGGGCKLFYNGADERKNGIEIVVREELVESVSEMRESLRQTNGHETGDKRVDAKHSKCICSTG